MQTTVVPFFECMREEHPGIYQLQDITHAQLASAIWWYTQEFERAPRVEVHGQIEVMSLHYSGTFRKRRETWLRDFAWVVTWEPEKHNGILQASVTMPCPPTRILDPAWQPEIRYWYIRAVKATDGIRRWQRIRLS
jgi:hypothetical protein